MTFQFGLTSCKDDSTSGTPRITSVTNTDPENQIEYTKAGTGSLLVVRGENLDGAMKVFINDQEVWFNPTMNTDHSIIVQVPSEGSGFVLTAFDSSLKDEIRVETNHGTAVYAFKITAPYPSASSVVARYPRHAGDEVTVTGLNIVDIERIFITNRPAEELYGLKTEEIGGTQVDATQYEITKKDHKANTDKTYTTYSEVKFTIPELPYSEGSLIIQCASGNIIYPFTLFLPAPTITNISTDMPVFGEELVISGTDFIQVEAVTIGDKTVKEEDYALSESGDEMVITFKDYMKPSEGSSPELAVTTGGGTAKAHFYDYACLLTDFNKDDAGNFLHGANNGWGPDASYETADGSAVPYTGDGVFAHWNIPAEGTQWWGTMIYWRAGWGVDGFTLPGFDVIPADASADEVYLAVEVYNNGSDYNNGTFMGYVRYMIQPLGDSENIYDNGFEWEDYGAGIGQFANPVLVDVNGETPVGRWYRHMMPLSNFGCYAGKTYADIVTTGLNQFRLQSINQGSVQGMIDVCFDNVRIFYKKK